MVYAECGYVVSGQEGGRGVGVGRSLAYIIHSTPQIEFFSNPSPAKSAFPPAVPPHQPFRQPDQPILIKWVDYLSR